MLVNKSSNKLYENFKITLINSSLKGEKFKEIG
jgi:hypothetical protein